MKINLDSKFLSEWKYYEVARYVPSLERVIREKNKILQLKDIEEYSEKNNNNGIYTSVFAYNSEDLEKATRLRTTLL
jgi:hypothetical protein